MKFYIASNFDNKEAVKKVMDSVRNAGHDITTDWTQHGDIRPYHHNKERSQELAEKDMDGVKNCDVLIVVQGENPGRGMYLELGVALALGKEVFVVNPNDDHSMLFFFHPQVKLKTSVEEVFKELNIV